MPADRKKDPFDPSRFDFEDDGSSGGRRQVRFARTVSILDDEPAQVSPHKARGAFAQSTQIYTGANGTSRIPTIPTSLTLKLPAWFCLLAVVLAFISISLPGSPLYDLLLSLGLPGVPFTTAGRRISPSLHEHVQQAIRIALESTEQPRDFALSSDGARIVASLTSASASSDSGTPYISANILTENVSEDSCWFFPGSGGQVAIRLPVHHLLPTHIAIDVILQPSSLVEAPRRIVVWGTVDGDANRLAYNTLRPYRDTVRLGEGPAYSSGFMFLPLADFEYNPYAAFPLQTFRIAPSVVASRMTFGVIVVEVRSNWGGKRTGICRVRVHGDVGAD